MIVLGKEKKMPESMTEMVDSLIGEAKKDELKFCGIIYSKNSRTPSRCMYRLPDGACFIGKFVPDDIEGIDSQFGVRHMTGDEGLGSWIEHFRAFNSDFLNALQTLHDCSISDLPTGASAAVQSRYFLERLEELKEDVKKGVYEGQ